MRRTTTPPVAALLVAGVLAGCGASGEDANLFVADFRYDTVAARGTMDETNPLFVYQQPLFPQLVDASRVVFGDTGGGRLIFADMVSGEGWQVEDDGANGPGEFGGRQFWLTVEDGRILTASQDGDVAVRTLDGALFRTQPYQTFIHQDPTADERPLWSPLLKDGTMVVLYRERSEITSEPQELHQGLRAYSRTEGILWAYDPFPPVLWQWHENPDGTWNGGPVEGGSDGDGFDANARLGTVVVWRNMEPWIQALNADGTERARVELPYPVYRAFIDADERVWVELWEAPNGIEKTGSYLVLDRDLNTLMRVTERGVMDARGDRILTAAFDSLNVMSMHLLERPPG